MQNIYKSFLLITIITMVSGCGAKLLQKKISDNGEVPSLSLTASNTKHQDNYVTNDQPYGLGESRVISWSGSPNCMDENAVHTIKHRTTKRILLGPEKMRGYCPEQRVLKGAVTATDQEVDLVRDLGSCIATDGRPVEVRHVEMDIYELIDPSTQASMMCLDVEQRTVDSPTDDNLKTYDDVPGESTTEDEFSELDVLGGSIAEDINKLEGPTLDLCSEPCTE